MSFESEYLELRKKRKKEEEQKKQANTTEKNTKSQSFANEYLELREKRLSEEKTKSSKNKSTEDIAPSKETNEGYTQEELDRQRKRLNELKEEKKRIDAWINDDNRVYDEVAESALRLEVGEEARQRAIAYHQDRQLKNQQLISEDIQNEIDRITKTYFPDEVRTWVRLSDNLKDGYDFGDVGSAMWASKTDLNANVLGGLMEIPEMVLDGATWLVGGVGRLMGNKKWQDKAETAIKKDLYDGVGIAKMLLSGGNSEVVDQNSVFGAKSDSLAQSAGQLGGTIGLQAVGVPWWVTTGATSFGGEVESALNEGAGYWEAGGSAAISAGAEILTEKLSGGISFGGRTLDDATVKPLLNKISNKVYRKIAQVGVGAVGEGTEEIFSGIMSNLGTALYKEENLEELLWSEEALDEYIEGFIGGTVLGGASSAVNGGDNNVTKTDEIAPYTQSNKYKDLSSDEKIVVDKIVEKTVAEKEANGETVTDSDKKKIQKEVIDNMLKGDLSIKDIEEALGGESYTAYKDTVSKEEQAIEELKKLYEGDEHKAELESAINNILENSNRYDLASKLTGEVYEASRHSRLSNTYNEVLKRGQAFTTDINKYEEKYRPAIQKALDSGVWNNTRRSHETIEWLARMSVDKGIDFEYLTNEKIKDTSYAVDGKVVNGFRDGNTIGINIESPKYLNRVVGHELTHILEGSKLYSEFAKTIIEYAESKGEYNKRFTETYQLYNGVKGYEGVAGFDKIKQEVVADLVGDYLFTDRKFVEKLSTNKNIFQKIFDEIKYLCRIATAGSKEAKQLERVKKEFERLYRGDVKNNGKFAHSLSMVEDVQPTTEGWYRTHTTEEAMQAFPKLWDVSAEDSDTRNPTQISRTTNTYRKIYDYLKAEGFNGTILDASSGLGYGTKAGIEEYGFDVEDIEPYPDANYTPKYTDYSKLDKKYDVIISSFVLNVLPQDQRDALVVKMGEMLNDGGRIFINVRSDDVESGLSKSGKNIRLGEWEWIETQRGSYQKGFKTNELVAYLKDALGEGYTVEPTKLQSKVAAIVTKDSGVQYSLSAEQEEYFKDSVVRNDDGSLKVMYHGTSNGGHTVFDTFGESRFGLFGAGTYFTDNRDIAESYTEKGRGNNKQVYESYLNITNPIDMDAKADIDAWKKAFHDADYTDCVTNEDCFRAMKEVFVDEQYPQWEAKDTAMDVLESMGYDGITHIGGGRVNADGAKHRVYIAFNPEQIKNIDNTKPTSNPDIRYSISEDSEGNKLTEDQQEFFIDSKARDENGKLIPLYHGTESAGFTIFDKTKDIGYFFTNKIETARSYSGTYGTFDNKKITTWDEAIKVARSNRAMVYYSQSQGGYVYDDYSGKTTVWKEGDLDKFAEMISKKIKTPKNNNYKVYLNLTNPLIVYGDGDNWSSIANHDENGSVVSDRKKTRDWVQEAVDGGYDGVIFKSIRDGGKFADEGVSDVYVALKPEQIKFVSNTNPTTNPDIRYSLSKDSDGNELTEKQTEHFKDSKMRDDNGNLMVMYHGSQDAGFHQFEQLFSDDNTSFFFVDNPKVAKSYSGTDETYTARTFRTAEDFNRFFEEIGADEYEVKYENGWFDLYEDGVSVAQAETAKMLYDEFRDWTGLGTGSANYKVYLNLKNPLIVDAKGRNWDRISSEFSQEIYDRYQTLTDAEKEALSELASWEDISIFRDELRKAKDGADEYSIKLADAYEKLGGEEVNMYRLFDIATDNFSEESLRENAVEYLNTRNYAQIAKDGGYDGVIFKNIVDNGVYASGMDNFASSTVAVAFESNQIKSVANENPTSNPDIRYSLSDSDGKPIDTARISNNELDVQYSLSHNSEIAKGQADYLNNQNKIHITHEELKSAQDVTSAMVDVMMKYSSILPEDKIGKVLTKNGSYDRSVENTTICVRTLAYNEFVDKVQEELGRPLTQMESFLVSQKLYDIATEPQCLYCYVSLDRKAFNDMLLRYMQDRDTVIEKYNNSDKTPEAIEKLYEEFLNGRKPTKPMRTRFDSWIGYIDNGTQLLSLADIATEDRQSVIKAKGGILAEQLKDARNYAQSASWSKVQKNYVAYRDEILKLGNRVVKNLNEHYGLRWYSFSDYSAAFIVENMQQITDASIRGLKGLSYTKDTDYAEIFAPSGMNINISVFVNTDKNGNFYIDEKQSANFERALELRKQYPNVGIVATVTNDEALRWVGEQEWSDVIIPFHIVRTGMDVAEYYKWLNYTSESSDTIGDKDLWNAYLDSLNLKSENARKKVSKNIYPNEHKNNKETYLTLCESRGLTPRFARFAGEDWYMKLVNETRLSADESSPLKPTYNLDAAKASFQKFVEKGGYEGGWYKDGTDVDAEAKEVADDVLAGKKANEVNYGRQDGFVPEKLIAKRKTNRTHGQHSLSEQDIAPVKRNYNSFDITSEDVMYHSSDIAPVESVAPTKAVPTREQRVNEIYNALKNKQSGKHTIRGYKIDAKGNDISITTPNGDTIHETIDGVGLTTDLWREVSEIIADTEYDVAPVTEAEANALQSERIATINERDMPPEAEAPYSGESIAPQNPFDSRDIKDVGNRKVKAYMYENPEVKPFFQEEARLMLGELERSTKGERWYNDELYYDTNGEMGFGGTKRNTSDDIAYLLDNFKYTYADIEKGLKAIIEDNGAENNAISKRIEFMLDERLRLGYQEMDSGYDIPANQEYINLLNEKQITEYNDEAFGNYVKSLSEAVPTAQNEIAPAKESGYEAIKPNPNAKMVRADKAKPTQTAQTLTETDVAPAKGVKEKVGSAIANAKSGVNKAVNLVGDKGVAVENLAKKTKNRELEAKYSTIRRATAKAQNFIGEGADGIKPLNTLRKEVMKSGLEKELYDYVYHRHNIDRMTLADRYEDVPNKAVFGDSVTADKSREIVRELEAKHPELREYAQDIYAINNQLRKTLVDGGVISQETADLWAEMYPHYVPIHREGDEGLNINVPLDSNKTGINAPIKKATGGSRNINPLFQTMGERVMQTFRAIDKNRFGIELKNTLGSVVESNTVEENVIIPNGTRVRASDRSNIGTVQSFNEKTGKYTVFFKNDKGYTASVQLDANTIRPLRPIKSAKSVEEAESAITANEELLQEGKNGMNPTFTIFENGKRVKFEITKELYDSLKATNEVLASDVPVLGTASKLHRGLLTEYNLVFSATNAIKDLQDIIMNSQHSAKTYANIPKAILELARHGKYYKEYIENGGDANTYFDRDTSAFEKDKSRLQKIVGFTPDVISNLNNFIEKIPRLAEYIASRKSGASIDVAMLDAARVTTDFSAGGDLTKFLNRNGFTFLNASVQGTMQQVRNIREAKMNGFKGVAKLAAKYAVAGIPLMIFNHLAWGDDEEYEELSDYVKDNYYIVGKFGDGQFVRIPKGRMLSVIQSGFEQMTNLVTGNDEADFDRFADLVITNLMPNNPLENNVLAPVFDVMQNETWYGDDLVPTRLQNLPDAEQYDESTDALSRWLGEKLDYSPYKINYLLDQYTGGIGDLFLPMGTPQAERGDDSLLGKFVAPFKDKFTVDGVMKNQNVSDFYEANEKLTKSANSSNATDEDILKSKYMSAISNELGELYQQKREIQSGDLADDVKYNLVREIQEQINELAKNGLDSYENVNVKGKYATVGDKHFRWYEPKDGSDTEPHWEKITDKQLKKQQEVTSGLGISASKYWSNKEEYDYAYDSPEKYSLAKVVGGYDTYKKYSSDLYDIKADKDSNGKSISGSRKEKVAEYINNLDADYYEKIILFKSEYNADDTYNTEIVNYINNRTDFTYEEKVNLYKELGFTVSSDGYVYWD